MIAAIRRMLGPVPPTRDTAAAVKSSFDAMIEALRNSSPDLPTPAPAAVTAPASAPHDWEADIAALIPAEAMAVPTRNAPADRADPTPAAIAALVPAEATDVASVDAPVRPSAGAPVTSEDASTPGRADATEYPANTAPSALPPAAGPALLGKDPAIATAGGGDVTRFGAAATPFARAATPPPAPAGSAVAPPPRPGIPVAVPAATDAAPPPAPAPDPDVTGSGAPSAPATIPTAEGAVGQPPTARPAIGSTNGSPASKAPVTAPVAVSSGTSADADAPAGPDQARDAAKDIAPDAAAVPPALPAPAPALILAAPPAATPAPTIQPGAPSRDARPARAHADRRIAAAAPDLGATPAAATPPVDAPAQVAAFALAPATAMDRAAPALTPSPDADARVLTHMLGAAHDAASLDRLARDIAGSAGNGPLRFAVQPDALGPIGVEIQRGEEGTAIRLSTASHATHTLITEARPQLLAEAQAQGVRISHAAVDLTPAPNGGGSSGFAGDTTRRDQPTPRRAAPAAAQDEPAPIPTRATGARYA